MGDTISKIPLLEWLDVEIDLSAGQSEVLKADRWAFRQVKKAIESGKFDTPKGEEDVYATEEEYEYGVGPEGAD